MKGGVRGVGQYFIDEKWKKEKSREKGGGLRKFEKALK